MSSRTLQSSLFWKSSLCWTAACCLLFCGIFPTAGAARSKRGYGPPKAALVLDMNSGKVLHAHNVNEPRYPASLTKIMTLYILFEYLREKRVEMDTELTVSDHAEAQSPSKLWLDAGDKITVKNAIRALVTKSANDVAVVVAEGLAGSEDKFAQLMTLQARSLGMTSTTFRNASGLPDSEQKTTAHDLAILAQRTLQDFPEYATFFRTRHFNFNGRLYRNHNSLLFNYAGTEGMKTGYTRASGFNLVATARRERKHLVAVVLGGASSRQRDAAMRQLLNASWRKASIHITPKPAPPAIAEADFPERNPAFHAEPTERGWLDVLTMALNGGGEAAPSRPAAEAARPAMQPSPPPVAVAAAPDGEEPEEEIAASGEGDTVTAPPAAQRAAPPAAQQSGPGPFHVQVGAYADVEKAQSRLSAIRNAAGDVIKGRPEFTIAVKLEDREVIRARYGGFSEQEAHLTCKQLKRRSFDCMVFRSEQN